MKKKILYLLTQTHYGGAQKYVHDLALSLSKGGDFEIYLAVGDNAKRGYNPAEREEGPSETWLADLKTAGINIIRLKHLKRNLSLWHDFLSGFELFRLYKKIKPDIIHLNSSKIGATGSVIAGIYNFIQKFSGHSGAVASWRQEATSEAIESQDPISRSLPRRQAGAPSRMTKTIYTVHGLILNEPLVVWRKIYYWLSEWLGAKFKDIIICVSEYDKKSLVKWKITTEKKIKVIHNGIDLDNLNFLIKEQAREKISQLSAVSCQLFNDIVVGTIAGLYKTKGLDYLIKSARLVINNLPEDFDKAKIKFLIIGSGPEKKNLENLIKKYNLKPNFFLLGQINNAVSLLKAFDIFVLPSVKEGLSYTLIEARAAQLPIITTNVGGNPEVIENEKTGLIIPAADPKKLAKAILNLLTNQELKNKSSTLQRGIKPRRKDLLYSHSGKVLDKLSNNTLKNLDQFSLANMIKRTLVEYE